MIHKDDHCRVLAVSNGLLLSYPRAILCLLRPCPVRSSRLTK